MLHLRPLKREDLPIILKWNENKTSDYLFQWAGNSYTHPLTLEQLESVFDTGIELSEVRNARYAIETTHNNKMIGVIELNHIDNHKGTASVCRFLIGDDKNRGKGYGKEALSLLTMVANEQYQIQSLFLKVFDVNLQGIRCYEKVGFKQVDYEQDVYHDGTKSWGRVYMAYQMA